MTDDFIPWLHRQLDQDEWWAREASRRGDNYTATGEHWRWEDSDTDVPLTMDPATGDSFTASLRSVEEYPTSSYGPLPHFAIHTAEEIETAVGGHIIRHSPARVLRRVEAMRRLIHDFLVADEHGQQDGGQVFGYHATGMLKAIKHAATEYDDQPGYQERWRP